MTVPSWIHDAVFYQIFPDRFFNGSEGNDPPNVLPWESTPTIHGFQGGDLQGILKRMDYLLDLGVNAIYLNPIFLSPSTHRYNIVDYFQIDPKLGDRSDFQQLLDAVHHNGMHLILDGVFNHTGRGFFAFNDILENQEYSAYKDWYRINHFPIDAYSHGDASDYLGWWKFKSLPKLNTDNPQVRKYIFDVARYWIGQGADGWRLDVPNEIDDDGFWGEFRQVVRQANPDAYLVGEIWEANPRWTGENHFDGLMNYPLRDAILNFTFQKTTATDFAEKLDWLFRLYPRENTDAMYNLLGSHDVARLWSELGSDVSRVKLAFLAQFSMPGVPAIYYGDEIGMSGGKDPDCRKAFPWLEDRWNHDLRVWVKQLVAVRKEYSVLKLGAFQRLHEQDRCLAFLRSAGEQRMIGILNASRDFHELRLDLNGLNMNRELSWKEVIGGFEWRIEEGQMVVKVQPVSGCLLVASS